MQRIHFFIVNSLQQRVEDNIIVKPIRELFAFGYLQAISCIFPVFIFLMLALSHISPAWLPRYDFMLIACLLMQVIMYKIGMESKNEVLVITVFHLLGLLMELHKVNVGSWSYPEFAYTKLMGVPLYSGFMYASVASFICQSWKNMKLNMVNWPKNIFAIPIGAAIYLNFFTNAFIYDVRWFIVILLLVIFRNTWVEFNSNGKTRRMPMLLAFLLIGFFIWLAENIATLFGAWKYAYQHASWQMVSWHKLSSWALLVIVSIIIVAQLKELQIKFKKSDKTTIQKT